MRPWMAAAAVAVLVAGVAAAVLLRPDADRAVGEAGDYPVEVVGLRGVVFRGQVALGADGASALGALLAAGEQGDFSVAYQGEGADAFVSAVDGQRNQGASGWCFEVRRGGAWLHPQVSSGAFGLEEGDAVRWYWGQGGCRD